MIREFRQRTISSKIRSSIFFAILYSIIGKIKKMGNSCDADQPLPDTTNVCSRFLGQRHVIPNFCTYAGPDGSNPRLLYCEQISNKGEWTVNDKGGGDAPSCHYNDCNGVQQWSGCCKGCCAIIGRGVNCIRKKFTGDPVQCCVNDLVCNTDNTNSPAACFSDADKQETCNPCTRDMTTSSSTVVARNANSNTTCGAADQSNCQDTMFSYCSGADIDNDDPLAMQEFSERWYTIDQAGNYVSGPCILALERNILANLPTPCAAKGAINLNATNCQPLVVPNSSDPNSSSEGGTTGGTAVNALDSAGVEWASNLFDAVFQKYQALGFIVGTAPGNVGYNPFQDFLYIVCCQVPVVCQSGLLDTCSVYTAQRLSVNPDVANICGCYLAPEEYATYVNTYLIDQQCTPMCNRPFTIPLVSGDNSPITCTQDVCIIDNITVNLVNTTVNGGININQMCGNCGVQAGGSCQCIIQNNTIDGANAVIGSINIEQSCSSTVCNVTNPGFVGMPPKIDVPCDTLADPNSVYAQALAAAQAQANAEFRQKVLLYLVIIFIALAIILILYYLIKPNREDKKEKLIPLEKRTYPTKNYRTDIGTQTVRRSEPKVGAPGGPDVGSRYTATPFGQSNIGFASAGGDNANFGSNIGTVTSGRPGRSDIGTQSLKDYLY